MKGNGFPGVGQVMEGVARVEDVSRLLTLVLGQEAGLHNLNVGEVLGSDLGA